MIKIHPKFEPLYKELAETYIITGERGSGKSFAVGHWLAMKSFQPQQVMFFTRFTLDSAKDSVIPEFNEKIEMLNAEKFFNITRLDVTNIASRSEIKFRGLKASQGSQTAKLKSLFGVTVWVIDEGEEMTDETLYDKLDKSVRQKDQKNIKVIVMNPTYRKHWIYKRFFRDMEVPENTNTIKDGVCYIHVTWEDNRENLAEEWVNEAERIRKKDPKRYKKAYTTGWLNPDEGLLYPELKITKDFELSKENTRIASIDTADEGKDYYAMPIVELYGDKMYLIDVIYNKARLTANEPLTIAKINDLNIDSCIIETNKEGSLYVGNLSKACRNTRIIGKKAPPNISKMARMKMQAGFVMERLRLLPPEQQSQEYRLFVEHTLDCELDPGKDQIDDAPDALALLAKFVRIHNLI